MLLKSMNEIQHEGLIYLLLLTDPSIIFHFTNVIAKDENNNLYITTYDDSKIRNLQILARLRYAFELNKTLNNKKDAKVIATNFITLHLHFVKE